MRQPSHESILRDARLRRYVLTGGAVALAAVLTYQAYHSDVYSRSKRYLSRFRTALNKYIEAFNSCGEITASLLSDLQTFLQSNSDDIPPSLGQLSKLLQSEEFSSTASTAIASVYRGIAGSPHSFSSSPPNKEGTVDKILNALLSDRGHSLVSVAVSMGAKNLVGAYVDASSRTAAAATKDGGPDATDKLFSFLSSREGQQLAVMAMAAFASNGMKVYMDKSLEVNFYDELFGSMTKPEHLDVVKQCVAVFARNMVGAYMNPNGTNDASTSDGEGSCHIPEPALVTERDQDDHAVSKLRALVLPNEKQDAVSVVQSPTASNGSLENGETAVPLRLRSRLQDDLDSDGLLHVENQKKARKRLEHHATNPSSMEWISAVGREWVRASEKEEGRKAMAAIVGTATREVVVGVASSAVGRISLALMLIILVFGTVTAVLMYRLTHAV